MKITYYRGARPNFGDELNVWMWPRILPNFFDEDEETAFLGIGSIIGKETPFAAEKIIFGAGYVADYFDKPQAEDGHTKVYFVRGPRTAKALGLSPDLSVGDAAILTRTLTDLPAKKPDVISFMPHWTSAEAGNWQAVCQLAGINFIDPTRPVEEVLAELSRSRLVIGEAMHAVIVADALRIPWVPLLPIAVWHRDKWYDWAEALDIKLQPFRLWPSNLSEVDTALVGHPLLKKLVRLADKLPGALFLNKAMAYLAAHRLKQAAKEVGSLSSDAKMEAVTNQMLAKVEQLRRDYPQKEAVQAGPMSA